MAAYVWRIPPLGGGGGGEPGGAGSYIVHLYMFIHPYSKRLYIHTIHWWLEYLPIHEWLLKFMVVNVGKFYQCPNGGIPSRKFVAATDPGLCPQLLWCPTRWACSLFRWPTLAAGPGAHRMPGCWMPLVFREFFQRGSQMVIGMWR